MKYLFPKRVLLSENVVNAEKLLMEKTLQIGLAEHEVTVLQGKASVILDFGREWSGGARILTWRVEGDNKVRLRFGESVSETCSDINVKNLGPNADGGATNDHSNRDFIVELSHYSDMTFGQTGFRFLRIDTLSDNAKIVIKAIVAAVDTDTRRFKGSFTCNDPLVNDIWNTAAHTLRLCLQNGYFWDGIKRDRLVWIGDTYPEMRAAHCLFGDIPETFNSLAFAEKAKPESGWIDNICTYSLWWLIILGDEYKINGDKSKFSRFIPFAKEIVERVSAHVKEDGDTAYPWDFLDWPSCYTDGQPILKKEDSHAGAAYLTKVAMEKARDFLSVYGEDVRLCEDILSRLAKKSYNVQKYKQIAAIGVWAGDKSENNERVLMANGAKGLSTFLSYFILSAVASYGHKDEALAMMKEYYGGMLSLGATSFWEDFDLDWLDGVGRIDELPQEGQGDIHRDTGAYCYTSYRHSFCHGWSAGVIAYLAETVAGIKPMGTGMQRIKIQPNLSGLKHIKINYPTPYGILKVEHTLMKNSKVKTKVDAPKGLEIVKE